MQGVSHSTTFDCSSIRWHEERPRPRSVVEINSLLNIYRNRQYFPDTRVAWLRLLQRQQVLSLRLDTLMEVRSGHGQLQSATPAVLCLALERGSDRLLLSGGLDGRVCLYRLDILPEADDPSVAGVDASRRGRTVIRPVATSQLPDTGGQLGHSGAVSTVQWYPEDPPGAFLSSSLDGSLLVWDTEHFEVAGTFQLSSKVYVSRINNYAHSGLVACGTESHGVRLCDMRSGDAVHALQAPVSSQQAGGGGVKALDWAPAGSGNLLVAGTTDGCVRLWDVRMGGSAERSFLMSFDTQQEDHLEMLEQQDLMLHPCSNGPVSARKRSLDDPAGGGSIDFEQRRRTEAVYSSAGQGGTGTGTGTGTGAGAGGARVRRREQARAASQAVDWSREGAGVAHQGAEVVAMKYSPSGAHLVTCGNDGQVKLWGTSSGRKYPIQFSPNCCRTRLRYDIDIVSFGGVGDEVLLYPQGQGAGRVAVSPLHSSTGESVHFLDGHVDDVTAIQVSTDKIRVVTAGRDGMIFLWSGSSARSLSLSRAGAVADCYWQASDDEEI